MLVNIIANNIFPIYVYRIASILNKMKKKAEKEKTKTTKNIVESNVMSYFANSS